MLASFPMMLYSLDFLIYENLPLAFFLNATLLFMIEIL